MGQFEIYTTGGGHSLERMFNFVAAFTSGPGYEALLYMGITIGVLSFAYRLAWGEGIKELFKWFVLIPVLATAFFVTRASVVIFDRTQADHPVAIVDNVPWGIAMIGNATSSIGHDITAIMEPLLSTPQDLAYQKSGIMFGAGLMAQSTRWSTVNSKFLSTLDHFMKRCGLDAANIGLIDIDELTTSDELVQVLQDHAPNALAFYDEFTGETVTCSQGIGPLLSQLDDYLDQLLISQANRLYADNIYQSSLEKVNRVTGSMDSMLNMISDSAATSRDMLAQSILVQALDDAAQGYIADAGNAAAMQHYQAARAERQTISSYQAAAAQGRKWMPKLKIVLEMVYYGMFPVMVILMFTPMAWTVLKNYTLGFVWLASWEPVNAIIHSIVLDNSAAYYREAGLMTEHDGTTRYAMTFSNHLGIRSVEADIAALAGSLYSMIPFLVLGLLYGASKLASTSTAMTNVAQSAAIETGREMATGNHSLATVSMNNYNANSMNTSSSIDTGRHTEVMPDGSSRTVNANGSTTYDTGTSGSRFQMGAAMTQSLRHSAQASYQEAQSTVQSARAEESQSYERAHNTYSEMFERSSMSGSLTDSGGKTYSEDQREAITETSRRVDQLASDHSLSSGLALSAAVGTPPELAAKINGSMDASTRDNYSRALQSSEETGLSSDLARLESLRRESGWQSTEEAQMGDSWGHRNLMNEANSARMSRATAEDSLQRAEQTQSRMASTDASVNANFGTLLQDYAMTEKGMSEAEMLRVLNPQPEDYDDALRLTDSFVSDYVSGRYGNFGGVNAPSTEGLGVVSLGVGGIRSTFNNARDALSNEPLGGNTNMVNNTLSNVDDRRLSHGTEMDNQGMRRGHHEGTGGAKIDGQAERNRRNIDNNDAVTMFIQEGVDTFTSTVDAAGTLASMALNSPGSSSAVPISYTDRDNVIRTIAGEAANQGEQGWAAVAHVIKNRVTDSGYGSTASEVALAPQQFSAWNDGPGGNNLVRSVQRGSDQYRAIGDVVDQVFAGQMADPTQGATHYYSPAGMQKLVNDGHQSNLTPRWLNEENNRRGSNPVQIGGHIFTGRSDNYKANTSANEQNASLASTPGLTGLIWPKGE